MRNSYVRCICFALIFVCLVCITVPAYADSDEFQPPYPPLDGEKFYFWKTKTGISYVESTSPYKLVYVGEAAQRDGETDSFSYTYSKNVSHGGTFSVPIKKFELAYGLTIGDERSYSVSKTSAPLKKGEYIKIYYEEMRTVYPCYQYYIEDTWHVNYAEDGGPVYSHTEQAVDLKFGYIYEPLMPRIKIEYYGPYTNLNRVIIESRY